MLFISSIYIFQFDVAKILHQLNRSLEKLNNSVKQLETRMDTMDRKEEHINLHINDLKVVVLCHFCK